MSALVDQVAKAIARGVMRGTNPVRVPLDLTMVPADEFETAFERLWGGTRELDQSQREFYRVQACDALTAAHDYLYSFANVVSNLGKPYTDNDFGRAAAVLMRSIDPDKITAALNAPPYCTGA